MSHTAQRGAVWTALTASLGPPEAVKHGGSYTCLPAVSLGVRGLAKAFTSGKFSVMFGPGPEAGAHQANALPPSYSLGPILNRFCFEMRGLTLTHRVAQAFLELVTFCLSLPSSWHCGFGFLLLDCVVV